MKKVFSSHSALCHEWAHQTQSEGRTSRMFFEGSSLYSYGKHYEIARVTEGKYLLADGKFSNSTTKHRYKVLNAIPGFTSDNIIDCFGAVNYRQSEGAYSELSKIEDKYSKAIKKGKYLIEAKEIIEQYKTVSEYLPETSPKKELKPLMEKFEALYEAFDFQAYELKEQASLEKREVRMLEQRRLDSLEDAEKMQLWKEGANVQFGWTVQLAYLRIKNDTVQTSKGVTIPKAEAKRLFDFILNYQGEGNFKVDNRFSLNRITENEVIIGCHTIEMTEIKRIGNQL